MAASPNFAHARKIIPPATQAAMIVVCKIERDPSVYCTILDCEWSLFFFRFSDGSARALRSRAAKHFARRTEKKRDCPVQHDPPSNMDRLDNIPRMNFFGMKLINRIFNRQNGNYIVYRNAFMNTLQGLKLFTSHPQLN